MANSTIQVNLTPEELKALVREAVREVLVELLGEDFSDKLAFAPEIAARLIRYRQEPPEGIPVDEL